MNNLQLINYIMITILIMHDKCLNVYDIDHQNFILQDFNKRTFLILHVSVLLAMKVWY